MVQFMETKNPEYLFIKKYILSSVYTAAYDYLLLLLFARLIDTNSI